MGLHIVQALIKVLEHVGEFVCADEVGSTRSIQPARHRLEIGIILEVMIYILGQVGDTTLLSYERFALSVEGSRLFVDSLERIGQGGQNSQSVIGALG